jgi:hypothetical protein
LRDAADVLGLTVDAVRKRVKRGTLESEKDADGRLYVFLDTDQESDHPRSDTDRLISTLEEQLRLEREAHAEARRLLAAALERIPAIAAPETTEDDQLAPETTEEDLKKAAETSLITRPALPELTLILLILSWVGVGSAPLLAANLSGPLGDIGGNLIFVLSFVLPFIFGLYRGVLLQRWQEFSRLEALRQLELGQKKASPSHMSAAVEEADPPHASASYMPAGSAEVPAGSAEVEEADPPHTPDQFILGFTESIYAVTTGVGAALVLIGETFLRYGFLREFQTIILSALWVFVGSFMFYIFAFLIGVATGGRQDERDTARSGTGDGRQVSRVWQNPQLIFGLLGTIITAIATVYAAFVGG